VRLNFQFFPYEDSLIAKVPEGFYQISCRGKFGEQKMFLDGLLNYICIEKKEFDNILKAILFAENHYKDICEN